MPPRSPDSKLISVASPGDFAAIFDRHFDAVYAYLQRRIGRHVAEELAAETFLVAFDNRERYDTSRPRALPWLLGIATNLLRGHRRREVRELRAYARSASDPLLDAFEGVEERLDASEERRALVEGLDALSADERDVLLLAAWGDLSYAEIAEALEIPPGTVRSRLARARGRMSPVLGGERETVGSEPEEREVRSDG